jgi:hypothetical protein
MFLSYIFSIAKNAFQLIKNILIQIQCFFVFATFPEIRLSKFFLSKSFFEIPIESKLYGN